MWVIEVPVVSTAHLPRAAYLRLELLVQAGEACGAVQFIAGVGVVSLWWRPDTDEPYDTEPELRALRDWAEKNGYEWIRLDGGIGDVVEGLPVFEW